MLRVSTSASDLLVCVYRFLSLRCVSVRSSSKKNNIELIPHLVFFLSWLALFEDVVDGSHGDAGLWFC